MDGIRCNIVKTNIAEEREEYNGLKFVRNKFGVHYYGGEFTQIQKQREHNADDMALSDVYSVLAQLNHELGINPHTTLINRIEFGVNIKLPHSPDRVLKCIILYKNSIGLRKNNYIDFSFDNYRLKIYDKSALTGGEFENENILRIEVAIKKMKHLRGKVSIKTLADLVELHVWERLENILIDTFEDCLIIDVPKTNLQALPDKDMLRFKDYVNPLFWDELRADKRRYSYQKKRCNMFIAQIGGKDLQEKLIKMIREKCQQLRDVSTLEKVDFYPLSQSAQK